MPYVRLALMEPKPEHIAEVRSIHDDLLHYDKTLPGYLEGYLLEAADGSGRLGRLIVWEHKDDADRAAQQQHTLTVRSALAPLI
ncbi:MAG: hypothetical protein ACR2PL_02290, partial [Dehalococcoidia bacterium]